MIKPEEGNEFIFEFPFSNEAGTKNSEAKFFLFKAENRFEIIEETKRAESQFS